VCLLLSNPFWTSGRPVGSRSLSPVAPCGRVGIGRLMITPDAAWALVLRHARLLKTVTVPLAEAVGLRLAAEVRADRDLPPAERSAMDADVVTDSSDEPLLKEVGEPPGDARTVFRMVQFLPSPPEAEGDASDAGWDRRPRLERSRTVGRLTQQWIRYLRWFVAQSCAVCVRRTRNLKCWCDAWFMPWAFAIGSTIRACQADRTWFSLGAARRFSCMAVSGMGMAARLGSSLQPMPSTGRLSASEMSPGIDGTLGPSLEMDGGRW
jgi:hypothetical protein